MHGRTVPGASGSHQPDAPASCFSEMTGNRTCRGRITVLTPARAGNTGPSPILDTICIHVYKSLMPHDAKSRLREHGVHVTAQRLAVMQAVSARPHGTADDVAEDRPADIGAISRQAVYDALNRARRQGPHPAHPARPLARALRGSHRRQPPPPHLPRLRPHGGRRLRRRRRAVPDPLRRRGLRDRRGRGDLLGPLPPCSRRENE
jgi:hypothetical protein